MKKRLLSYQPRRSQYGQIIKIYTDKITGLSKSEVLQGYYNKPFDVLQKDLKTLKLLKEYKNCQLKLTYIH